MTSNMNKTSNLDLQLDSTTSINRLNLEKSSDDDVEILLKKMEHLLSPNDLSLFDSNGNKSVSDILKAADELVHSSSPLFEALSPTDKQKTLGSSQTISSKSFKIDIPQIPQYNKSFSLTSNSEHVDTSVVTCVKENSKLSDEHSAGLTLQNKSVPMNLTSNINENLISPRFVRKQTPELKSNKGVTTKNINENKHNKDFQFLDIVNVAQDKQSNPTKKHYKFDKHRQLNIKHDLENEENTEKIISNHRLKNNKNNTRNPQGIENNLERAMRTKNEFENINKHHQNLNIYKSKNKEQLDNDYYRADNDDYLLPISDNNIHINETALDIVTNVQNLTKTISPIKVALRSEFKDDIDVSHGKQELKMSDLAIPGKGEYSLEEELKIQRNKVRQLKEELSSSVKSHLHQLESIKAAHEEELAALKKQLKLQQEAELKRGPSSHTAFTDKATTPLDDHLLSSYDKENKKLCQEIKTLKTEFREAERTWIEEKSKLVLQLDRTETDSLKKQLREAKTTIRSLEQTLAVLRATEDGDSSDVIQKLEHQNFQLMNEICELTKKINDSKAKSEDMCLSQEAEIARLHNELKQCKALFPDETNVSKELKTQLSEKTAQLKTVLAEKEILARDHHDLQRQVKELELIIKKRNTTGFLTITGQEFFPETEKIKHLESQVVEKDKLIEKLTKDLNSLENKYKTNIEQLEAQLKSEGEKVKVEIEKLRKQKAPHAKEIEEMKRVTKKANVKEYAQLLATIRGLQSELLNRDKIISKVNKELDDAKKTNRTLQKEREKILSSKNDSKHSSTQSLKHVGTSPLPPAADNSAEVAQLKLRIQELEDDMVTLHEKAASDVENLREQHRSELSNAKQGGSVAELEGQIYTQEIIISHLKQKLAGLEAAHTSQALLKLENEKLASQLTESNSLLAKLKDTPLNPLDPSGASQSSVLSKIDFLEKRHEVREKTLQAIIHELLSDKNVHCLGDCQSKLLDKNREICFYRAEMDRILDSLRQFKQTH